MFALRYTKTDQAANVRHTKFSSNNALYFTVHSFYRSSVEVWKHSREEAKITGKMTRTLKTAPEFQENKNHIAVDEDVLAFDRTSFITFADIFNLGGPLEIS